MELITTFSQNWNGKLLCDNFSTIRLECQKFQMGDIHQIQLNKQFLGYAKIVAIRTVKFAEINDNMAYIDSGGNEQYIRNVFYKMYGKIDAHRHLAMPVFQWTQRHLPAHQEMFLKYWEKAKEKHTTTYRDAPENQNLQFALDL